MSLKNFAAKLCIEAAFSLSLLCSTTIAVEAGNARTMTFPSDRSYGTIINLGPNWNILEKHPKGTFFAEAKGTIPYSTDDALMLTARFPLTENPSVMNKLPVDAFQYINITNLPAEDKIFGPLSHLTGLRRLDFEEGEFHDKAFSQLSKLVNLEAITVRECFVTGESLTHFGSLKKLQYMSLKKIALDWNLLCKSAAVFPAMTNVHFTDTNLSDQGLKWLEKMPNLARLTLDGDAQLTDKGLLTLKKLKQLRKLELKKLNLTANGIIKLQGTGIKALYIEDMNFNPTEIKQIKDSMPDVLFHFGKRKIKEGTMEIFAPLH